jgi:hypothetical protein
MALIVETGSCVANANALVTRAELIAYAADFYPDVTVVDDETTDGAIMRTSLWLSSYPEWDGSQTCGRGLQGLAWPRTGVTDCNDDPVPSDEVPIEVKQSTYVGSMAELVSPGVLSPTITPGKQKKSVKVDVIGEVYMTPVEQGVKGTANPVETLRPVLTTVNDLIRCMGTVPDGRNTPWPWVA